MPTDRPKTTYPWPEGCAELDETPGALVATCRAQPCVCFPETNTPQTAEVAALRKVLAAARRIRHWHDRGDGMVVSAEHVRLLWAAISEHDDAMGVPVDER